MGSVRSGALGMAQSQHVERGTYSKPLVKFVESVCKNITLSKSLIEKNLEIYAAQQNKVIDKQEEMLKQLKNEIEELNEQLRAEKEDVMTDEERAKFHKEVEAFLNDTADSEQQEEASERK